MGSLPERTTVTHHCSSGVRGSRIESRHDFPVVNSSPAGTFTPFSSASIPLTISTPTSFLAHTHSYTHTLTSAYFSHTSILAFTPSLTYIYRRAYTKGGRHHLPYGFSFVFVTGTRHSTVGRASATIEHVEDGWMSSSTRIYLSRCKTTTH